MFVIKSLLENLTFDNDFKFNDRVYRQIDGVSMGGLLSCAIANIFMCHHETRWLEDCPPAFKPLFYGLYIDDIFTIFRDPSHLALFFEHLNSKHPSINFTWESEDQQSLPFLDVRVHRGNGSSETSLGKKLSQVYRQIFHLSSRPNIK